LDSLWVFIASLYSRFFFRGNYYEWLRMFLGSKRFEVYADTLLDARDKAVAAAQATTRKKVKPWDVTAVLAEMNGEQVTHSGAEL
jgi:hypothetical protein